MKYIKNVMIMVARYLEAHIGFILPVSYILAWCGPVWKICGLHSAIECFCVMVLLPAWVIYLWIGCNKLSEMEIEQ